MAQKMLISFTNISAEILLNIFTLLRLHQASYFGAFSPNAIAIKSLKNNLRKSCSVFGATNIGEINPYPQISDLAEKDCRMPTI